MSRYVNAVVDNRWVQAQDAPPYRSGERVFVITTPKTNLFEIFIMLNWHINNQGLAQAVSLAMAMRGCAEVYTTTVRAGSVPTMNVHKGFIADDPGGSSG